MKNNFFEENIKKIFSLYSFVFTFRIFEIVLILYKYGYKNNFLLSEFIGLIYDFSTISIFILGYSIIFLLFFKQHLRLFNIINFCLLFIFSIVSFFAIHYFSYQLIPLDIFLYQYSLKEILFTIKNSSTNFFSSTLSFIFTISLLFFLTWRLGKLNLKPLLIKVSYLFLVASIPLFFIFNFFNLNHYDKFSMNKAFYFISESIKYVSKPEESSIVHSDEFQKMYPQKKFISQEYPLLHKADRDNKMKEYFLPFESPPNIVLLIVEGLSNDFTETYKGVVLMPFLNELKNRSLYWKRCFTVGERSFAVVPSILGGLPYGEKGFTLEKTLPLHTSLVPLLSAKDYYTSFYYGQSAWFHRKDRFLKYNKIDLIFDKHSFSKEYQKIITGDDSFFWGYNDKDLFNQSLKNIQELKQDKRFDIYFTGTSHSPFVLSNAKFYENKLKKLTPDPYKGFYKNYSKYLQSLLFVDDALKDFFHNYKKIKNYENTLFIITGDHPMTEIPIANSLKRYHVPLFIFSEKLKKPHTFSHTVSHLDFPETLLTFIQDYIDNVPEISSSLGDQLFTENKKTIKKIAFMNDNRQIVDFLYGDYYLSKNKLYFADSVLKITEIENDTMKMLLNTELNIFKNINQFVCQNNKIISNSLYSKILNYKTLYKNSSTKKIKTSSEYFNLTENILIPNVDMLYDVKFNSTSKKKHNISIVYEIKNSKDSVLLWKNFNPDEITNIPIPIKKIDTQNELYFKSYIWNKDKKNFSIPKFDISLYVMKVKNSK